MSRDNLFVHTQYTGEEMRIGNAWYLTTIYASCRATDFAGIGNGFRLPNDIGRPKIYSRGTFWRLRSSQQMPARCVLTKRKLFAFATVLETVIHT